jgi:hypothetical protein
MRSKDSSSNVRKCQVELVPALEAALAHEVDRRAGEEIAAALAALAGRPAPAVS